MIDPAWPFGIAFIILAVSLRKALPRLIHSIADRNAPEAIPGTASAEEVDELRHRLAEMEERLDFAERMLAERKDQGQLPPGA